MVSAYYRLVGPGRSRAGSAAVSAADVLAFSPYNDGALLVVEEGKIRSDDVERALQLLRGVPLIGTMLNKGRS